MPTAIRSTFDQPPASLDRALDLGEEHLGVPRTSPGPRADRDLPHDLAVGGHAHDGAVGRGVDTEDQHQ